MVHVLFILAEGFEELEFVAPFDILKRGNLAVTSASISSELEVSSVRKLRIKADVLLSEISTDSFELIFLPGGGPGTENLRKSPVVLNMIKRQMQAERALAAICAAPLVLADANLLKGKYVTSFPSTQSDLLKIGANVSQERVVQDGLIFTSRGAGSAAEFGFALLAHFAGKAKADEVKAQMQFAE